MPASNPASPFDCRALAALAASLALGACDTGERAAELAESASGTVMETAGQDRGEAAVPGEPAAGGDNVLMAEWAGPTAVCRPSTACSWPT